MPRTLFLHIGLPKTASTFLQKSVFEPFHERRTVLMPDNRYFCTAAPERLTGQIFGRSETIWKYKADEILDELFGRDWYEDGRDILLSDEAIGRSASRQILFAGHLAAMKAALKARGIDRVKLLCLIRRQDHWLISHYVQMSDRSFGASQVEFERLVDRVSDPRQERFTFGALLDYASIHAACVDALGVDSVTLCPMEWLSARPDSFRDSLGEFLELPSAAIALRNSPRENVRREDDFRWQVRPMRSRALHFLQGLSGRPSHIELTQDVSRRLLDVYRESNLELAGRSGLDLADLGYFSPEAEFEPSLPRRDATLAPAA